MLPSQLGNILFKCIKLHLDPAFHLPFLVIHQDTKLFVWNYKKKTVQKFLEDFVVTIWTVRLFDEHMST